MDAFAGDQDRQVKKLKRQLESWREIILPLHSILTWDQTWYPGVIFGFISTIYFLLWLMDPPILTMIATTGITLTLADVLVPILIPYVYTSSSWTKNKEKLYEEICKSVVIHYNWMFITCQSFYRMRDSSPQMYYALLISLLGVLAWIGATIDNMLILYVTSVCVCLLPGLLNNDKFCGYLARSLRFLKLHKTE